MENKGKTLMEVFETPQEKLSRLVKELEEKLSYKKPYSVHISYDDDIVVYAEDIAEARRIIEEELCTNPVSMSDYDFDIRQAKSLKEIGLEWSRSLPFGVPEVTCSEYFSLIEEVNKQKKIIEELDKNQLKFNFIKEMEKKSES